MKILIIGSGGREHALAVSFCKNGHKIFCLPGNAGTEALSFCVQSKWKDLKIHQHERLATFVESEKIDLTVIGPETPLAEGIVDFFKQRNLKIFGPTKHAANLESSKVMAKHFMTKYQIPTAPFYVCETPQRALELIPECLKKWKGIVIKPDGLTAGKGVIPCNLIEEAKEAVYRIMHQEKFGAAGKRILIEKMLFGPEVSVLAFCDGETMIPMLPSQDHKRLLDGDRGPNTGGVGAYCPLPFLSEEDVSAIKEEIIQKTLSGLQRENIAYKGVIYFGLMLTSEGPQLLEYNCRFGDPEAQVILPLLESDLGSIMLSCIAGNLASEKVIWSKKSACCVVFTSQGYPDKCETGYEITGLNEISKMADVHCFHAGTMRGNNQAILTNGGRVLGITAVGEDLEAAIKKAYDVAKKVTFHGAHYRWDIGHKGTVLRSEKQQISRDIWIKK